MMNLKTMIEEYLCIVVQSMTCFWCLEYKVERRAVLFRPNLEVQKTFDCEYLGVPICSDCVKTLDVMDVESMMRIKNTLLRMLQEDPESLYVITKDNVDDFLKALENE